MRIWSRNSNIMRPISFDPQRLRTYLQRHTIADLPALKHALGSSSDLTVFRKLKALGYLSSYTHRGRFYTLRTIARFDEHGLWSHEAVWFSRHGTLMATLEAWVPQAPQGWFAEDLADQLHVHVHDPLHELVRQGRVPHRDRGPVPVHRRRGAPVKGADSGPPHGPGGPLGGGRLRAPGLPRRTQSGHPVVLRLARRTATAPLCRLGIDQTRPGGRYDPGHVPQSGRAYRRPRPATAPGS